MGLEFENPQFLWLLLLVPVAVVMIRFSLTDAGVAQRVTSLCVRALILILLVLSLSGALWKSQTRNMSLWVLGDLSDSVPEQALTQVTNYFHQLKQLKPSDTQLALGFFAEQTDMVETPVHRDTDPAQMGLGEQNDPSETDLEKALQQAVRTLPHQTIKRVLLMTDGNETKGDVLAAAKRLKDHGVEVYTHAFQMEERDEALLEDLIAPTEIKKGQSFTVTAIAHASRETSADLVLYRDGFKVSEQKIDLKPGANSVVFNETQANEGLTRYELRLRADHDFYADNNVASGIVSIEGEPRILLLENNERDARYLARALEAENIRVEIREGRGMPGSLDELAQYDAVLFSDVPATEMSVSQMNLLRTYVEDLGGGFVMLGGEESFGLGGYYRTSIEQILPLRMRSEKKKDTPSLAMMLIIDKSGSMSGDKIELAKEASIATVELLNERDYVSVIAFDGDPYMVVDMQGAGNQMGISQTISQIQAGGGTSIHPALVMAQQSLFGVPATFKHVILLTDGHSQPGDFAGAIDQLAGESVTVSTVGVGEGADNELLQDIARWGKGRYYFTSDAYDIPQIFTKETMTASKSSLVEEPFLPQVFKDHPMIRSIPWEDVPFLFGYVVTSPKATADVSLVSERGDPVLASWQVGLGRCAAFTSDAKSRWAADWIDWPGYGQFWAQLVRYVMRSSQNRGVEARIEWRGDKGSLTLDSADANGHFLNELATDVQLIKPDLSIDSIETRQIAPGRYVADFDIDQTGSYLFKIRQSLSNASGRADVFADMTRGLTISYAPEYRHLGSNTNLLTELAQVTGGTFQPTPEEVLALGEDESIAIRKTLWPGLLMAALILFVLDVALRRLDLAGRGLFKDKTHRYG
jgi:Mg-chelatase subunit ChlD